MIDNSLLSGHSSGLPSLKIIYNIEIGNKYLKKYSNDQIQIFLENATSISQRIDNFQQSSEEEQQKKIEKTRTRKN